MPRNEPLYGWLKDAPPRPWRKATPPLDGLARTRPANVVALHPRGRRVAARLVSLGSGVANALVVGGAAATIWPF